jgi:predicted kinase
MSKSVTVLITGLPGTGKTTLGKRLSATFNLPFISKDAIKERIFDNLGWSDKIWSLKVSAASHRIMDYMIEEELKAGHSVVVESNFKRHIDSDRFRKIQADHSCEVLQILCWAKGEIAYERFMERMNTTRHPGHVEAIPAAVIRREFIESGGRDKPVDIDGTTIEVDTTDFRSLNHDTIY